MIRRRTLPAVGLLLAALTLLPQSVVHEEVRVSWWTVPIFVLDAASAAVGDLRPEDLQVEVAGRPVTQFQLFHRPAGTVETTADPAGAAASEPLTVLLLFDNALTDPLKVAKARTLALHVVDQAPNGARFQIMTIEPQRGLTTITEPLTDRAEVRRTIGKRVVPTGKRRLFMGAGIDYNDIAYSRPDLSTRLSAEAAEARRLQAQMEYNERASLFIDSLKTLQILLQTMRHKVVYLFSTGINNAFLRLSIDLQLAYNSELRRIGTRCNESGSLFFVVNPAGASASAGDSGDESLRALSSLSGGGYFNGSGEEVTRQLTELHHSAYEIAFPDPGGTLAGNVRVSVRREGLRIFTVPTLVRGREYTELTREEKTLLAYDAVSSGRWAATKLLITTEPLPAGELSGTNRSWRILLPEEYRALPLEVFRLALPVAEGGERRCKRQKMTSPTREIEIRATERPGYRHALLVVCPTLKKALLLQ